MRYRDPMARQISLVDEAVRPTCHASVEEAAKGETIIIAKGGGPTAPYPAP